MRYSRLLAWLLLVFVVVGIGAQLLRHVVPHGGFKAQEVSRVATRRPVGAPSHFRTLAPGASLPSGGRCAAWVRSRPLPERKAVWLRRRHVREVFAHIHPDHEASTRVAMRAGLEPTNAEVDGERVWRADPDDLLEDRAQRRTGGR